MVAVGDSLEGIVGVQVQIGFEPELFKSGVPIDLTVKLVPVGNYLSEHYESLSQHPAQISVAFDLLGFNHSPEQGRKTHRVEFDYTGHSAEQTISVTAGPRVGGTDYREFIYLNRSLARLLEGNIAPGNGGYYLRRPQDTGEHFTLSLF